MRRSSRSAISGSRTHPSGPARGSNTDPSGTPQEAPQMRGFCFLECQLRSRQDINKASIPRRERAWALPDRHQRPSASRDSDCRAWPPKRAWRPNDQPASALWPALARSASDARVKRRRSRRCPASGSPFDRHCRTRAKPSLVPPPRKAEARAMSVSGHAVPTRVARRAGVGRPPLDRARSLRRAAGPSRVFA